MKLSEMVGDAPTLFDAFWAVSSEDIHLRELDLGDKKWSLMCLRDDYGIISVEDENGTYEALKPSQSGRIYTF